MSQVIPDRPLASMQRQQVMKIPANHVIHRYKPKEFHQAIVDFAQQHGLFKASTDHTSVFA